MQQINDNLSLLSNGEPRNVLDEECLQLGIPNIPEYVDAIGAYGEKRLVVISAAAAHFLTDKKIKETDPIASGNAKQFKQFLEKTTGKRGELKMFKPKNETGE
jgi:hypothetical protein